MIKYLKALFHLDFES